jgi:hypothetical protein
VPFFFKLSGLDCYEQGRVAMKNIFILFLVLTSVTANAGRFKDIVHSISLGKVGEDHLIFLGSGRVLFMGQRERLPEPGNRIEVELDDFNNVRSLSSLPNESMPEEHPPGDISTLPDATVLNSYAEANSIFRGMNRSYRNKSECTDRAHVWTYEEWKKHGLISKKVFLFFTNTYIRRYNYHWWFHVSPYTLVNSTGGITEYVMDRRYSAYPLTMKNWTDIFIRSKRHCPVTTYRHYRANKYGVEHCFAVKSSMYNRLPLHVRQQEDNGRVQTAFSTSEVNFSYRAFTRRSSSNLSQALE